MLHTDHHTGDAPRNWDPYASMLREHGRVRPPVGMEERLLREWDDQIQERRRSRFRNRILLPLAVPAVMTGVVLLITSREPEPPAVPANVERVAPSPEPVAPATRRDHFPAPAVPPIWTDSAIPSEIPGGEDIGPGLDPSAGARPNSPVAGEPTDRR